MAQVMTPSLSRKGGNHADSLIVPDRDGAKCVMQWVEELIEAAQAKQGGELDSKVDAQVATKLQEALDAGTGTVQVQSSFSGTLIRPPPSKGGFVIASS